MKITLLHYTSAPAVGGVETILAEHSRLFAAHGHEVEVICGEGAVGSNPAVSVVLAPEMQWNHPLMLRAQREISVDRFGENFAALKNALVERLGGLFEGRDVVFLHNVLTMPFQLGLTEALWELADRPGGPRFVAWVHDLPAANPDWAYRHLLAREPWAKLARRHPRIEYVAVSELRRAEFAALTGSDPRGCRVVPNGIDPVAQLGLTENVAALAAERALLERDIVLIHPARILARKNIELSLRVTAELKRAGLRCCCMVTGAPDRYNPNPARYHDSLLELRRELGLGEEFLFLHELFAVTNADLIGLYRVADVLFFPSKQEGFGLPILEGGLHGIPIFCADIEPMRSLAHRNITFFNPDTAPGPLAETIASQLAASPAIQAKKAVAREYSWETIYRAHLEPLLKK